MESLKIAPLIAAVNAVMREVSRVAKTGENKHHRYKYASEQDLLEAVRPAMVENGLILIPSDVRILNASKDGKQERIDIAVDYHLHHTSGMGMKITVASSGIDGQDKALPKAMTMALKYAVIQTFMIPRGDDPDRDQNKNHIKKPQKRGFNPLQDMRLLKFLHDMDISIDFLSNFCLSQNWPVPNTWNEARMLKFMAGVHSGNIHIDRQVQISQK